MRKVGTSKPERNVKDGSLKVTGTSPLSFEVNEGDVLAVRQFGPSSHNRPTVGGGFKTHAYLIFNGITKVGRLSPKDASRLAHEVVPDSCVVVEVDAVKRILKVALGPPATRTKRR
jgi:hypothetical protein